MTTHTTQSIKKARREQDAQVIKMMTDTWPLCFTKAPNVKPISRGIHKTILTHCASLPGLSKNRVRRALRYYTHSIPYLSALLKHTQRYNLKGMVDGVVTPEEKAVAARMLSEKHLNTKKTKSKAESASPA